MNLTDEGIRTTIEQLADPDVGRRDRAGRPPERLALLAKLRGQVDTAIEETVRDLRHVDPNRVGYWRPGPRFSWADIGAALGLTKQAAAKRYSDGRRAHSYMS